MIIEHIANSISEHAISGIAKLIMTNHTGQGAEGFNKLQIGGVVITHDSLDSIGNDWNMMECEIIIIPKKLYAGVQGALRNGLTGDQMLTCGYNHPENWKKCKEYKP